MRRKWYFIAPMAIIGITVFMFLGGEVVMRLWNWLLPPLFGWHTLTFWQALGMLVLSRILFGRLGGHGPGGGRWRRRWEEKYAHLTPEERERFFDSRRSRCGSGRPPVAEPTPTETAGQ